MIVTISCVDYVWLRENYLSGSADTLLDFLSSLTRSRDQKIVHIDLASMVKNALKFDA